MYRGPCGPAAAAMSPNDESIGLTFVAQEPQRWMRRSGARWRSTGGCRARRVFRPPSSRSSARHWRAPATLPRDAERTRHFTSALRQASAGAGRASSVCGSCATEGQAESIRVVDSLPAARRPAMDPPVHLRLSFDGGCSDKPTVNLYAGFVFRAHRRTTASRGQHAGATRFPAILLLAGKRIPVADALALQGFDNQARGQRPATPRRAPAPHVLVRRRRSSKR